MVSDAGRPMNLLLKRETELCIKIVREIGSHQKYLPDVHTSEYSYVQFEGFVKSNGAHHSIMSGDNHYKIKEEFYNGNGGFVFDFYSPVRYPLKIKWGDYHYCERSFLFTSQIDQIRSFSPYFNSRGNPDSCHKLFNILKKYVDGNVYQTGWLLHELNQRLARVYKNKLSKLNKNDLNARMMDISSEESEQSVFMEISNSTFEHNILHSAGGWNCYMDPIVSNNEVMSLVNLMK